MNNIIITGASRGIGAEIAKKWCKIDQDNFYYSFSRFSGHDVSLYGDIYNFLDGIEKTNFPIALINNAGIIALGTILELSAKDFRSQIDTNLNGVFNCSKAYIEFCIKYKMPAKIINIASTAGLGPRQGRSAYAASKAGVINLSLSMAEEVKEHNIKVYCVCPGAVDTDMRHSINPDDDFENMMKPETVAKFIINLIENGEHIDNQVLKITR